MRLWRRLYGTFVVNRRENKVEWAGRTEAAELTFCPSLTLHSMLSLLTAVSVIQNIYTVQPRLFGHIGTGTNPDKRFDRM